MAAVGARSVPWARFDHRVGRVYPPLERVGSPISSPIAVMVWAVLGSQEPPWWRIRSPGTGWPR